VTDYPSWDGLAAQIENEDVEPEVRSRALSAIPILKHYLGSAWPSEAVGTGHALLEPFFNQSEWTRHCLSDVAASMEAVSILPGWDQLLQRILRPTEAIGALFELDLAARGLKRSLGVALEPPTQERRHADLALSLRGPSPVTLYVEASTLHHMTRDEREADDFI